MFLKRYFILALLLFQLSCGKSADTPAETKIPQRIVSLAPSLTEMLSYIGEGDRLAGVTTFCDYPPEVTNLPKVGGLSDFDIESVVSLKPDLVLAAWSGNPKDKVERLESLGIKVMVFSENTAADILSNISILAGVFGKDPTLYLDPLKARFAGVVQNDIPPTALVVISIKPIFSVSTQTFIGDILRLAGYENSVKSPVAYPMLSDELLASLDPDYIFAADDFKGEQAYFDTLIHSLKLKSKVYYIDTDILSRPGPRIADILETLAGIAETEAEK
ncbi:MAG: hypothetical protein A2Y33_00780 [Spirochaetes bacterium GWF1_51_8]|nr:MAG: hypothetical protein A2Y33_00780 [Spirochaetes bacterium GWF1_51_8]